MVNVWILIRALALSCNINIGLYEDGEQNAFEDKIAVNYRHYPNSSLWNNDMLYYQN